MADYITTTALARAKRCSVSTVKLAIADGKLAADRIGARTYAIRPASARVWFPRTYRRKNPKRA